MATFVQDKMPKMLPNDMEGNLKKLHKYMESQAEQLSYVFGNLGGDNFNTQDMNNFVANLGATNIITQTIISNSVVTKSLYAERGDIAQLTVDWLSTSKKVMKYLNGDTTDDNYLEAHEQGIELKTASVVIINGDPLTEVLKDRYGNQLYWQRDISYAEIIGGFPYVNGKQVYMDTEETEYPVKVYQYKVATKMRIDFEEVGGVNVPRITMGNVVVTDNDVTVGGVSVSDVASRLTVAENKITTMQTDLDAAESAISGTQTRIETLSTDLGTAKGAITTMQSAINDLTARVIALETPSTTT